MILSTENLTLSFGGLVAVEDLSIQIGENELVGLIGSNGAGKTTVLPLYQRIVNSFNKHTLDCFLNNLYVKTFFLSCFLYNMYFF